jgi:hypothetical protein
MILIFHATDTITTMNCTLYHHAILRAKLAQQRQDAPCLVFTPPSKRQDVQRQLAMCLQTHSSKVIVEPYALHVQPLIIQPLIMEIKIPGLHSGKIFPSLKKKNYNNKVAIAFRIINLLILN